MAIIASLVMLCFLGNLIGIVKIHWVWSLLAFCFLVLIKAFFEKEEY